MSSSPAVAALRVWPLALATAVLAACGDSSLEPPGGVRDFAAAGSVHAVSGAVPPGLTVTLVSGSSRVSAPVTASGSFHVELATAADSVDLLIDDAALNRMVLPSLVRVPTRSPALGLRIVLVPARWTVQGGTYHGQTVPVSLDDAFRPPCTVSGDTNCDGFFPAVWTTGIKLWPASGFPVPVAFDRARSHQQITAADSATLWSAVNRMNGELGVAVFRPARPDELALTAEGQPAYGVAIRVDTTLAGFGAWTNWWWDARGEMYAGRIRVRSVSGLRSSSLMTHELLHTQGFKHSCSWTTVMGGYGCGSAPGLTAADVAYTQLARAVHDAQRVAGAPHGLLAALQGERVVLRDLPPVSMGVLNRLRSMRTDSITHGDHAH